MNNLLTEIELVSGIKKTISNANSLLLDGQLLYHNKRFSRAYTLLQLSIEEAGKSLILYNSILRYFQGEAIDSKHLTENGYYSHKSKTKLSIKLELFYLLLFKDNIINYKNALKELIIDENLIDLSDHKKNESLYVSLKKSEFLTPEEIITQTDVEKIYNKALRRVKFVESFMNSEINNLKTIKSSALTLKTIIADPKLDAEYLEKIKSWINE